MNQTIITYNLDTIQGFYAFYNKLLLEKPSLIKSLDDIDSYKKGREPIIYTSLLNKIPPKRSFIIKESKEFAVPCKHMENWGKLKNKMEGNIEFTEFLSKETKNWRHADMLLFTYNITHIHLTTKNGYGTNKELVFGIFKGNIFYALWFGDHHDLYKYEELFKIAESNWPEQLFKKNKTNPDDNNKNNNTERHKLSKRDTKQWANDPNMHYNKFNPLDILDGHQHTTLISVEEEGEGKNNTETIKNVPFRLLMACENEERFLRKIENEARRKYGYNSQLSLGIDLKKRIYTIRLKFPCTLSLPIEKHPFPGFITSSNIVSEHMGYNGEY